MTKCKALRTQRLCPIRDTNRHFPGDNGKKQKYVSPGKDSNQTPPDFKFRSLPQPKYASQGIQISVTKYNIDRANALPGL